MLYKNEIQEIAEAARREVHKELASIEAKCAHDAGSYNYLCSYGGVTFFAHQPVGYVIRSIYHPH